MHVKTKLDSRLINGGVGGKKNPTEHANSLVVKKKGGSIRMCLDAE